MWLLYTRFVKPSNESEWWDALLVGVFYGAGAFMWPEKKLRK